MTKLPSDSSSDASRSAAARRAAAVRTAWMMGAIAFAIYVGFLVQGAVGQ